MRPIVVFDTNILISGTVWKGTPYHCLELARTGIIQSLTCQEILDEFKKILLIKLNRSENWINETIIDLLEFMDVIRIPRALKVITDDPTDDVIIECAVVGRANFIVTGDQHLLSIGNYQGISIIKAKALLVLPRTS
jgi:putative PIN family toxin of toxin-antitoxin system